MKINELIKIALKAKDEYGEQIDAFVAKLVERSEDPNDYITMKEFEELRKITGLENVQTLTDFSSQALGILDSKELNNSKKASSSGLESS